MAPSGTAKDTAGQERAAAGAPHVLVTGAARGIGRAVAEEFARALAQEGPGGGVLSLVDLDGERLTRTARELGETGSVEAGRPGEGGRPVEGGVVTAADTVDLAGAEGPATAVARAWEAHGPVDILVNAAGAYPSIDMLEVTADGWDRLFALNTRAPVLATAELARRAVASGRGASVVNISSGAALRARPGGGPYAATKAALETATRAAALELGPHGIRVNAVSPGFVPVDSDVNPVAPEYAAAVSANPLGRPGTPADIARAVRWIAGPDAAWITGEVLRVDGGSSTGASHLPRLWPPKAADDPVPSPSGGTHARG
ncbi:MULTISPECIES: SDR family oxidoreductase [unclassified Streptomyces]|uniref:SDR family NAD(P)-dependent oxidoreductase n=1 Tax=unclassified Streptomyces TaxID=2593676 RepID=UPI002DD8DEE5|nr:MULTISPECIES: SDR family oxidoreductase [unclassified Streptomyces]WSB75577.1 SDR family oxidoreductase [Streptomyces sp. NBC_01775]WSS16137.1 SDR family oxidoreductase [Streptomyces sp. NBC_01186]WSS44956.1 SDR family oxidoreductase [Streptomyces sp. NBC_01187]